jgi:hypothetical protein
MKFLYIYSIMKLTLPVLIVLALPVALSAQVTLKNVEDFEIGNSLNFQQCDTVGVKPGFTGPKQTWDFSTLTPLKVTQEDIVSPGSTPFGTMFPKANMAEKNTDKTWVFVDKEDQLSYLVGFVSEATKTKIEYHKPIVFAKRPVSFGGTNSYAFTSQMVSNNIKSSGSGMMTIAADGYGTLTLPGKKKYSNVLRIKITQKEKDTLLQYKSVTQMLVTTYVWFDEKHKSALLRISTTNSPGYNSKSVEYLLNEEDK